MQYRRSLDSWFVDGGYLSKPLNEVKDVLKQAMEGKDEIMEQHSGDLVRELYLNNPNSEFRVADDIEVKSKHCQTRTIDILLEVKQTRTCIKKVKEQYKDLLQSNEVPSRLMEVVNTMIEDWQQLVKYHRKRTLTSMLNYDLALCQKLKQGKHTYRIILETQFPTLVRVQDDGFNDNEIAVPHAKVTVKEEPLTTKDTQVTIDSETHN